jgi:MFS family permease
MVVIDNTILTVALPHIAADLDASESDLQWITTAYGLVLAGLLLPLAVVGDRRGRKGLLLAGLAIFGTASALAATSTSPAGLAVWRGVMGLGGACAMPATLSVLGNIFPEHERPVAIAIWSSVASVAAAAGPLIGGLLLDRFWWGSVFLVNVPVALAGLVGGLLLVPRSVDRTSPRLDRRSSMLWWGALTAAVVAIIEGPERGWASPLVLGTGLVAVGLFVAFRRNERRSARPLIDAVTADDPRMRWGVATMGAVFFATYGGQFILTQWLQGPERVDALTTGFCFLPSAVAAMVASLANPRTVERLGRARVVSVGLLLLGLGWAGAALAIHLGSVAGVVVAGVLFGLGVGTAATSGVELIMSSAPPARAGSAAGVNETVVEAGGALGVAVLGSVLAAGAGYSWPLLAGMAVALVVALGVHRRLAISR